MKFDLTDRHRGLLRAALATAIFQFPATRAATLYWDTNAETPGSGNSGGAWDSGANWSTGVDGDVAPQAWVNGESAVFSAGTDGLAAKTVTLAGTVATPFHPA